MVSSKNVYSIACLLVIMVVACIRIHLADIPFERDEGEYAYAGQLILKGEPPYLHVYNMKFPGVYYMYALSIKLFGEGVAAPRYLVLVLQLIAAALVFFLARLAISPQSGWFAAVFFMLFNLALPISGCQSNAEHFLVVFLVASMYFLYKGMSRHSHKDIFVSGMFMAIACIMKQHAFFFIFASGLWIIYMQRTGAFKYLLYFAIGGIIPVLLMCACLWHAGVWDKFYFLTIQYAREYVGMGTYGGVMYTLRGIYTGLNRRSWVLLFCLFAGLGGLLLPAVNMKTKIFILLFLLASIAAVIPGFYFRGHYFLVMVPGVALLIAYTAFILTRYFSVSTQHIFLSVLAVAGASSLLYSQRKAYFEMNRADVIEYMYPCTPFAISEKVAAFIMQHSEPDDRICQVGAEPQLFFLSQRRSASGYIYIYPLLEPQKYAAVMTDEFIHQSEESKSAILIYSSKSVFEDGSNMDTKLYKWFNGFKDNYKLIGVFHAQSESSPMTLIDTVEPMDTLAQVIPQIKVYKRLATK